MRKQKKRVNTLISFADVTFILLLCVLAHSEGKMNTSITHRDRNNRRMYTIPSQVTDFVHSEVDEDINSFHESTIYIEHVKNSNKRKYSIIVTNEKICFSEDISKLCKCDKKNIYFSGNMRGNTCNEIETYFEKLEKNAISSIILEVESEVYYWVGHCLLETLSKKNIKTVAVYERQVNE